MILSLLPVLSFGCAAPDKKKSSTSVKHSHPAKPKKGRPLWSKLPCEVAEEVKRPRGVFKDPATQQKGQGEDM